MGRATGRNFRVSGRSAAMIPAPSRDLSPRIDWCRWGISAWIQWPFPLRSVILPLLVFLASEIRSSAAYWGLEHGEGEAWARGYA